MKCSLLKTAKKRPRNIWYGPCCKSLPPTGPPPGPPPPPPNAPPPPPPPSLHVDEPEEGYNLKVLQYNINGICNKLDELLHYVEKNNILIAAIQETKLTSKSKQPKTPNYTFVRKDRGVNKGGGLAFLVHKDINFTLENTPAILEQDPHLETMTISIPGENDNDQLYIRNVYIPPQSSCAPQYSPPLNNIYEGLGESSMVLGDVNAHHELWLTEATTDTRGRLLVDSISGIDYGIINGDHPTRVTPTASTAPDISITSSNLIPTSTWKVESKMSSDHLPIIISLSAEFKKHNSKNYVFINYNKADWANFTAYLEKKFSTARPVRDVHKAEKYFRNHLNDAAKKFIPAGRIPQTFNALPTEAARKIDERDAIRKANPADDRIPVFNHEIDNKIKEYRNGKWSEHLSDCKPGSKVLWNTIKNLNDQPITPDNQNISFSGQSTNDALKMATGFNKQYTPTIDKKPEQALRNLLRSMRKKTTDPKIVFTPAQTQEAIKKSKSSKSIGPDGISPIMLKHLGPLGIQYLTNIYNYTIVKTW